MAKRYPPPPSASPALNLHGHGPGRVAPAGVWRGRSQVSNARAHTHRTGTARVQKVQARTRRTVASRCRRAEACSIIFNRTIRQWADLPRLLLFDAVVVRLAFGALRL